MKRLGKFTGHIYSDNDEIYECCLIITEDQANNKEFIEQENLKNLIICGGCFGCPAAEVML